MSAWTDAVLALSPSAFHRMGEASGAVLNDSSGNAAHGTIVGSVSYNQPSLVATDSSDGSMLISPASEYATSPVNAGTGTTVMFSYKGSGSGGGLLTMFGMPSASTAQRNALFVTGGNVAIQYKASTTIATSYPAANIFDDLEHLIAVDFADGLQRLFVDGNLVGSTSQTGVATPTGGVRIGQFSTSHFVNGLYDEFVIFPSLLTEADHATLFVAWSGEEPGPPPDVDDLEWDPVTMLGGDELHPNNTGMTYLARVYEAYLDIAGMLPSSGDTIYAYGDSWTSSDFENTAGLRAIQQFTSNLGLTLTNRAVSGYKCADVAARAIGTGGTYAPGASDLVLVQCGVNDLLHTDTAQKRDSIEQSMRSLLAALSAGSRIEQSSFTFGGTWVNTAFGNTGASGGTNAYTQAATDGGATATYSIGTAGDYYLHTIGVDGTTVIGGKIVVTQGATTLGEIDVNALHVNTGKNPVNSGFGPSSLRLENVQTGTLTVTHYREGRVGTVNNYLDALTLQSATPPTILLVKPVPVLKAAHDNDTLLEFMRDLADDLATEFGPHVVVADPMDITFLAPPTTGELDGSTPALSSSLVGEIPPMGVLGGATPAVASAIEGERPPMGTLSGSVATPRSALVGEAAAPSWTFTTPTATEQSGDFFFGRFGVQVGISLIKRDDHYEEVQYPWLGELQGLTEGDGYFLGGHVYRVNAETAAALAADGYPPEGYEG